MKTLLSLLAAATVVVDANAALSPDRLRCEYATDPLGVDVPHPRRLIRKAAGAGPGRPLE